MKKLIALVCAAVMTVSSAVAVFAQPSVQVTGVVTKAQAATDANGNAVTVEIKAVPDEYKEAVENVKKEETLKEVLGADFKEGMQVVDVKDISVPDGTTFPVTITFEVAGVTEGFFCCSSALQWKRLGEGRSKSWCWYNHSNLHISVSSSICC